MFTLLFYQNVGDGLYANMLEILLSSQCMTLARFPESTSTLSEVSDQWSKLNQAQFANTVSCISLESFRSNIPQFMMI